MCKNNIEIVLDVLKKHDPYGLADLCGRNEYDIEAKEIAKYVNKLNAEELAEKCKEIFTIWLYPKDINHIWLSVAKDIKLISVIENTCIYTLIDDDSTWECSNCRHWWTLTSTPKKSYMNYCPICGAKIIEEKIETFEDILKGIE